MNSLQTDTPLLTVQEPVFPLTVNWFQSDCLQNWKKAVKRRKLLPTGYQHKTVLHPRLVLTVRFYQCLFTAHLNLATMLMEQSRTSEATSVLVNCSRIDGNQTKNRRQHQWAQSQCLIQLSKTFVATRNLQEAHQTIIKVTSYGHNSGINSDLTNYHLKQTEPNLV